MPPPQRAPTTRSSAVAFVLVASLSFAASGPIARWARPTHPMVIACGRVLIAALVLFLLDARGLLAAIATTDARQRRGIAIAGALLGAHFTLFLWGLDTTSLPAAVSLVSLEPLSVVLCGLLIHAIRPSRLEWLGVVTATVGAAVMALAAGIGEHRLAGDLTVIGAVVLYGFYVAAARSFRGALSARHYAALVYAVAAIAIALVLPFIPARGAEGVLWPIGAHAALAIVALAMIPTIIGHTAVQAAAQHLPPSTVALVSPGETLGGLVIGAVWLGAIPSGWELVGGAIIVVGATFALLGARSA